MRYLALGDSMSIDLYPDGDAAERLGCTETGLGAASLLHRNVESVWPEFAGKDLRSIDASVAFENRTSDGAMIGTVLDDQLSGVAPAQLVTLTIGGNDLLCALALASEGLEAMRREVADIGRRYADLVARLRAELPGALLLLSTIYDPTDGTGLLWPDRDRLPVELLKQLNERIRAVARATPRAAVADVHLHFLGHGVHAAEAERWYWPPNPIEPSARGASEIRRVFWKALEAVL